MDVMLDGSSVEWIHGWIYGSVDLRMVGGRMGGWV
jgi:hypothetical protein